MQDIIKSAICTYYIKNRYIIFKYDYVDNYGRTTDAMRKDAADRMSAYIHGITEDK